MVFQIIIWFKSYLNKKKQRVYVNGVMSDTISISTGVPQVPQTLDHCYF